MNPEEFSNFVKDLNNAKISLGNKNKTLSQDERKNTKFMKRSIYINNYMKKGKIIKLSDLEFKRPLNGIPSSEASKVLGKKVAKNIKKNTRLKKSHIL